MHKAPLVVPADFHEELVGALGNFVINSPFDFSFANEPPIDVRTLQLRPGWGGAAFAPPEPTEADLLVSWIRATLYDRCYAHRIGGRASVPTRAVAADPEFARRLAEANASREHWDKGWVIHQLGPNGQVFVRKGDRERAAMPGAFISEAVMGMAPQIGATVSLRAPRETLDAQPGYYFAFGETLDELADQLSLVRFYFHCDSAGAVLLIGGLTTMLNRFQVPFQLKAPAIPTLYGRRDAAVLYFGARYFTITARIVAQLRETVPLESYVPLFTKRLWPGIGVAVEPGSGESFGTHRCRLAAEGIVDAWHEGSQDVATRLAATAKRFASAGLDLARPWLGPGSVDLFALPDGARFP
jgi:HopA1 effector protein family